MGFFSKKKATPFVRTADTLRSQDTLEVILAVSEGEIEGLENGAKSFYLGETPLENADGSRNFQDFDLAFYPGAPLGLAEAVTPLLGGQSSNLNVGTALEQNVDVTRQLTKENTNRIDVRLVVNALYRQNDKGMFTHALALAVAIKKASAPNWDSLYFLQNVSIEGKTTSSFVKELSIPVEPLVGDVYQVRVVKLSEDSDGDTIATDVVWESIQETQTGPVVYPNTAVIQAIGRASQQFSSIPQFSGVYKGIKVKVPSNYNTTTRAYTDPWDGTFKIEWTDNPAWILYDFVTNTTYGMSSLSPLAMDKFATYEAAKWCDELVPNGAEGTEPRFTFNAVINTPRSMQAQARFIAGTFNATVYPDGAENLVLAVDKDEDPVHMFTPESVQEGLFNYTFTDVTSWYNDITVSFINPELNWQEDRRRVFDQASIDKYGRIPLDFVAHGAIKESEAVRRAYYRMNTALTEKTMVSFTTDRLGAQVRPFDVILISDPDLGYALSGRISEVNETRTTVTFNTPVYLEAGVSYKISFRIPKDDDNPTGIIERSISLGITGLVEDLNVFPELPTTFPEHCNFIIEQAAGVGVGAPKPYRVLSITESADSFDKVEITALEVNRNKYTDSENSVTSTTTDYSALGDPSNIPAPMDVAFQDVYDAGSNTVWTIVEPTLDHSSYKFYSGEFEVWSRPYLDGAFSGAYEQQPVLYGNTLVDHREGLHQFKILPKNLAGQTPPLALMPAFEHTVGSASALAVPPDAVSNLEIIPTERGFIIDWDAPSPSDRIHHYVIREGSDEETAVTLADNITETFYRVEPMQKRSYTFWVYAVSTAYVESEGSQGTYTNAAPIAPTNFKAEVAFESIMLFFDRNTEIDIIGYRIQFRKVGENDWADMDPNGLFDTGEPDTAYEFRVAALDWMTTLLDDEIWSIPISAKTRGTLEVEKGLDAIREATTPNILRNGSFEKDLTYWSASVAEVLTDLAAPYADPINGTSKILKLGDGVAATSELVSNKVVVQPKRTYTLSFDMLKDADDEGESHYVTIRSYNLDGTMIHEFTATDGKLFIEPEELDTAEWKRFSTSFTLGENARKVEVVFVAQGTGVVYLDGVQLQRGSSATAFNPHVTEEISPEDLGIIQDEDLTPPDAPTGLLASGSFKNIVLTWNSVAQSDVKEYEIYRSTTNLRSTSTKIGSSSSTVFADAGLTTGQAYYYWIRAVDESGNAGGYSNSASATTIQLASADYQDLSIVNAKIADLAVDDAKIATLSAAKLTAGIITTDKLYLGDKRFELDGAQKQLRVKDAIGTTRVRLGKLGEDLYNYGIEIYDQNGSLILGADGLGLNTVDTAQINNGAITGDTIAANTIQAVNMGANSVTAYNVVANTIEGYHITANAVTADKLSVSNLSAISANLGAVTAGKLSAAGALAAFNYWDLNTGEFRIGPANQSQYIWFDPVLGKIIIKGEVVFQGAGFNYDELYGTPQSLSDINSAEGNKLGSVEAGADVTSNNISADTATVNGVASASVSAWASNPADRINRTTTTINGAKITTGTIDAEKLSVNSLSAISANLGRITAGYLQSSSSSSVFINLGASGSQDFIKVRDKFRVDANGNFYASGGQISGDLVVDGTISNAKLQRNAVTEYYQGNEFSMWANGQEKFLIFFDSVQSLYDIGGNEYFIAAGSAGGHIENAHSYLEFQHLYKSSLIPRESFKYLGYYQYFLSPLVVSSYPGTNHIAMYIGDPHRIEQTKAIARMKILSYTAVQMTILKLKA